MSGRDLNPADFSRFRAAFRDNYASIHFRRLGGEPSGKEQIGFGVRTFYQDRDDPAYLPLEFSP